MKNKNFWFRYLMFSLTLVVFGLFPVFSKAEQGQNLGQEELVNLVRPAVVRIVQHVKGEAVVKPFKLDFAKMAISPGEGVARTVPLDVYLTGSGFIVSEDGYIFTNSHVVSDRDARLKALTGLITEKIGETPSVPGFGSGPDGEKKTKEYVKKIKDYLLQNSEFNFEKETVVLNPSSTKSGVTDLMKDGFPAQLITVNDNFFQDGLDVALIKIDQNNLPSLAFGDATALQEGEKIGLLGFPTTAELDGSNLLDATFTQGVISAIKDSENQDYKIIQTDAKISDGSSGSPILNESGEVIGMVTYQTERDKKDQGDNFAFGIQINAVQEGILKFNTTGADLKFNLGQYNKRFIQGIGLFRSSECKEALPLFAAIKGENPNFNVAKSINPYIRHCDELIANNRSVDTLLDKLVQVLTSLSYVGWLAIVLLLSAFAVLIIDLIRQRKVIKKEEKEIEILEDKVEQIQKEEQAESKEIEKIEEEMKKIKKS